MDYQHGYSLKLYGSDNAVPASDVDMWFAYMPMKAVILPDEIYASFWEELSQAGCTQAQSEGGTASCDCEGVEDLDAAFPILNLQFYT